jgi:hypothetical protein
MTLKNLGIIEWGGGRDMETHRTYHVKFLIETDDIDDGPEAVTAATGLPAVGSSWTYGNDNDAYALCTPIVTCDSMLKRESNYWWILSYEFTTKPWLLCLTSQLTHPASQPDVISGSFVNYSERVCKRRDGKPITSSSLEPIWVDRDRNRPTVSIQQTRVNLELGLLASMIDTLNDATLWGLPKRCVKLRNTPWQRLVWGQCSYYFRRTLEFDVRYETFDETEIRDQGHRWLDPDKLAEDPALDRTDPDNFTRAIDARGNVQKPILLDGNGERCTDPINHTHYIPKVELYNESNFYLLGVPALLQ